MFTSTCIQYNGKECSRSTETTYQDCCSSFSCTHKDTSWYLFLLDKQQIHLYWCTCYTCTVHNSRLPTESWNHVASVFFTCPWVMFLNSLATFLVPTPHAQHNLSTVSFGHLTCFASRYELFPCIPVCSTSKNNSTLFQRTTIIMTQYVMMSGWHHIMLIIIIVLKSPNNNTRPMIVVQR